MQNVLRSLQGNLKMLGQASAKLNFVVPFTGSSVVLRRPLITPVGGRSPYTPALARSAAKRSLSSARTSLMQANANSRERDNERTLVRGRRDWGWPFSIMRRDPFFMSPLMDLDRFWSDFDALAQRSNAYLPALDITETNDAFVVSCELAGVPRENVKIALDGDILTVQGEKKWEHEEKDAKMHRMERSYGSFSRSLHFHILHPPYNSFTMAEKGQIVRFFAFLIGLFTIAVSLINLIELGKNNLGDAYSIDFLGCTKQACIDPKLNTVWEIGSLSAVTFILGIICAIQGLEENLPSEFNTITHMFHKTEIVLFIIQGFAIMGQAAILGFCAAIACFFVAVLYLLIRIVR